MLFKHHYSHLFIYNNWATQESIKSVQSLSQASERMVSVLSHIISAQQLWYSRVVGEQTDRKPWEVYTFEECTENSEEITARWLNFLEHTSDDGLSKKIHYSNTKGEKFDSTVKDILTHVINHSTYHRAQIALLVREASGKPAVTDYIFYQRNITS